MSDSEIEGENDYGDKDSGISSNERKLYLPEKRHFHDITLPCIVYSVQDGANLDEQSIRKYHIEVSGENEYETPGQVDTISVVCRPILEKTCDIMKNAEQVIEANHSSDDQKIEELVKVLNCFEKALTMIDRHTQDRIDGAENKIDSSVSEVKDSIQQLREAIERRDENSSDIRDGPARHPADECTQTEDGLSHSDKNDGDNPPPHKALLKRNSTHEFFLSNEDEVLTTPDSSAVDTVQTSDLDFSADKKEKQVHCVEITNDGTDDVDDTYNARIKQEEAGQPSLVPSWKIEPVTWRHCIEGRNETIAYNLLMQRKLPDQVLLDKACTTFGRTSVLVSNICSSVCSYLQEKSKNIFDVWPAYEYNKTFREGERNHVTFVVLKENESDLDLGDVYKIYERTIWKVDSESTEVNKIEYNTDMPFDKSVDDLCECVNQNSESLMDAHSNLTMVSASLVTSKGYKTAQEIIKIGPCVVLYVHIKGLVPLKEEPFPEQIKRFPVDIKEAVFVPLVGGRPNEYHENLRMGCAIRNSSIDLHGNCSPGTLGAFLNHPTFGLCCITCAHVLFDDMDSFKQYINGVRCFSTEMDQSIEVFQPSCLGAQTFGKVVCAVYNEGGRGHSGVDAALVKITSRSPVDGFFPDTHTFEESGEVDFAKEGDSGAFVFVEENEELIAIGLLEGSMGDGRFLVTPIEDVLRAFSLPKEGTLKIFPSLNIPASASSDSLQQPHVTFRTSTPQPQNRSACTSRSDSAISMSTSMSEDSNSLHFLVEEKLNAIEEKVRATDEDITQEVARHAADIKKELNHSMDEKLGAIKAELKQEIQQSMQELLTQFIGLTGIQRPQNTHV